MGEGSCVISSPAPPASSVRTSPRPVSVAAIPSAAIVRTGSDTALLERLGATLHRGDLTDSAIVRQALDGADVVVHCAAKVGDWGRVEDYRAVNVEALRGFLEAVRAADR